MPRKALFRETPAAIFSWDSGAELFLEETTPDAQVSSIRAVGVASPGQRHGPASSLSNLRELLYEGIWEPELGVHIAPLTPDHS
ncbi:hypothetical protein [Arthrobacter psychrolactophilus]